MPKQQIRIAGRTERIMTWITPKQRAAMETLARRRKKSLADVFRTAIDNELKRKAGK